MITSIKSRLEKAFKEPDEKFCYFTGNRNSKAGKILGREDWDWTPIPSVNIEPYFWNTHTLALAFGCEASFTSEGKEWVRPLITDPSMINDLEIPNVYAGRTGEILKLAAELKDKNALVRLPDIQSPLGVAELMMGDIVYLSLLTHPKELHLLLEKISHFTIDYVKAFRETLGTKLNPSCHPQIWCDSEGYYISDDANSLVSPEMHKEFSVDYINSISDELGPVIYHTCTWTDVYLENIRLVKNKKIVNWSLGTSMDPAAVIAENSGKSIISPHIGRGMHREDGIIGLDKGIHSEADLLRYLLSSMQNNSTLYIRLEDSLYEYPEIIKEIHYIFDEFGYLPPSQT